MRPSPALPARVALILALFLNLCLPTSLQAEEPITFSPSVTGTAPEDPRSGEPSIIIDREGFVYAGGIRGLTSGGADLWRWDSKNDPCLRNPTYLGETVQRNLTNIGGIGGGDGALAISQPADPDAIPVLTFAGLALANVPIQISFDRGATWEVSEAGDLIFGGEVATDRHWLVGYGESTVYLSYRSLASTTLSDLFVTTSIDHGRTWTPKSVVRLASNSTPGALAVDRRPIGSGPGSGNVYYSHQNATTMFVSVASPSPIPGVSPTGGPLTFQTFVVDNTTGHGHLFDVVSVGTDGTVYACWSNDFDIFFSFSRNQGRTWSPKVKVNSPAFLDANGRAVRTNLFPWMVAGDPGRVGITWFGSNGVNNGDNNSDWAVYYAFTSTGLDAAPTWTQVQASDGYIHATNLSEAGLGSGAANNRNLLDFFMVDMDPSGAAIITYADDHNDFDGQTYVTRQVSGPSLLASVGTVPSTTCPPVPFDHNPLRLTTDPEVIDFPRDAQLGRRGTLQADSPLDITGIKYMDTVASSGQRQLAVRIGTSLMTNPPPEGFHWYAWFTANASNNLFDRGQSFYIEASTDPSDNASALAPQFFYGTSARRLDGGFTLTRRGTADGGAFDAATNSVMIALGLDKINAIANPPLGDRSRLIGLRGLTLFGTLSVTTPAVLGTLTGSDLERDFTRGGIEFFLNGTPVVAETLDCGDPAVARQGGWHEVEDSRATNGHYCRNVGAKNGNAFLQFSYTGTQVDLQIARGPRGGNAEVLIDGASRGKVDFFRPPTDPSKPDNTGKKDLTFGEVVSFATGSGSHTFRLNVLNDAAGAAGELRDMIYVDGFVITAGESQGEGNPTESSTVERGTAQPSSTGSDGAPVPVSVSSAASLLTSIVESEAGAELDLLVTDPLGATVGLSQTSGPVDFVRAVPSLAGLYTISVVSRDATPAPYLLYTVQTVSAASSAGLSAAAPHPAAGHGTRLEVGEAGFAVSLAAPGRIEIRVFNVAGRVIRSWTEERPTGTHLIRWDGRGSEGGRAASGLYLFRLTMPDGSTAVRKGVLLR